MVKDGVNEAQKNKKKEKKKKKGKKKDKNGSAVEKVLPSSYLRYPKRLNECICMHR